MIKQILDKGIKKNDKDLISASAVNEVKLLLESNAMEDLHLLQTAFPNSTNVSLIKENVDRVQVKKLSAIHNGDIYTKDEIKQICLKYRLRFLSSNYFKGNIPVELLQELKSKFTVANKLSQYAAAREGTLQNNLFMLAPSSMFTGTNYLEKKKKDLREAKRLRNLDPACFVKIEEDKYLFIKEWGNSFSIFRRLLGSLTAKVKTLDIIYSLGIFLYLLVGIVVLAKIGIVTPNNGILSIIGVIVFVLVLIWFVFSSASLFFSGTFFLKKYRDNTNFGVDKNYATEENWNKVY